MIELTGVKVGNILWSYVGTYNIDYHIKSKMYKSLFEYVKKYAIIRTTGTGRATRHIYDKTLVTKCISEWETLTNVFDKYQIRR